MSALDPAAFERATAALVDVDAFGQTVLAVGGQQELPMPAPVDMPPPPAPQASLFDLGG